MTPGPIRGDLLLHPVVVTAVVLMAVNDHVLKGTGPGWFTGKASGVAGLIVVPLLLVALWEWRPGGSLADWRAVVLASLAAAVAYALVELVPAADTAYEAVWGVLRWPLDALASLLGGQPVPGYQRAQQWRDLTDLLCLPAAFVAVWIGFRQRRPRGSSRPARTRRSEACEPGTPAARAGSAAG